MKVPKITISSILLFLLNLVVMAPGVLSQTHFQIGVNALGGFPEGEFKDNVANAGGGIGIDFIYYPGPSSIGVGANFGFIVYGSETRPENVATSMADFDVDVNTTNNILQGHLFFRAQRRFGRFQPYLEGLVGLNYLFTETRIGHENDWDDDDGFSETNFEDTAMSYGTGAGVMIKVYEKEPPVNRDKSDFALFIDIRLRYLKGNQAEYLKKGSITRVRDELYYDIKESDTDLITAQLGVSFNF